MLSALEETRLKISRATEVERKSQFGQYLTPAATARFMAGLFHQECSSKCRLLDPGAGIGSLSSAFLERCDQGDLNCDAIDLTAFEMDGRLHGDLARSLAHYSSRLPMTYQVRGGDFVEQAVDRIQFGTPSFTHAILNPPYKKIATDSRYRFLLRQVGIETVNLYSAFVALTLALMAPGGQVVAIIPRSFCNGPYYRPFREFLLKRAALRRMHLFDSRSKPFRDDSVLQENVIVVLERDVAQGDVIVSTSTDDSFADLRSHSHPFDRILRPDDPERFIHIPTTSEPSAIDLSTAIRSSLDDLGIAVSTGPVVDFRLKAYLRDSPGTGAVPLLYPLHFRGLRTEWPRYESRKPNAIVRTAETERWLYPNGNYCVVRRFSAKEEKRRVIAGVVQPAVFEGAEVLGFENHLNVFHKDRRGLPEALAYGLAIFLNSTAVDQDFRRFNGHTQVNATDLRRIMYPSHDALVSLGRWVMDQRHAPSQAMIDDQFAKLAA